MNERLGMKERDKNVTNEEETRKQNTIEEREKPDPVNMMVSKLGK